MILLLSFFFVFKVLATTTTTTINDPIIEIDYTKANKNHPEYEQVPQKTLLWHKYQAQEPLFFPTRPLKGRGSMEPLSNEIILSLRKHGIETYVNYYTSAKAMFYSITPNYEVCTWRMSEKKNYQNIAAELKLKGDEGKKVNATIPFLFLPSLGRFMVLNTKLNDIKKYLYSGSKDVYNFKDLILDENLKTVIIVGAGSVMSSYVRGKNQILLPQLKKRVYEFVPSEAIQLTLMLNGKRMDWVDMTFYGDYDAKKLGLSQKMSLLNYTNNIDPSQLSRENDKVMFYLCLGDNSAKINKIINIANESIKKLRTNKAFWTSVLRQFAIDTKSDYIAPEDYYYTKLAMKYKTDIDAGLYD